MSIQPHPEYARLARFFRRIRAEAESWSGAVFRSTTPSYARSADLVSGQGARLHGGRWNAPGTFATFYGSATPELAMDEVLHHFRHYGLDPATMGRRIFCVVEVRLEAVLDLTAGAMRRRLRVSGERMRTADWRRANDAGEEAITQAVGRAAFESGLEGLVVPPAPADEASNLVVFPANLAPGSVLAEKERRLG